MCRDDRKVKLRQMKCDVCWCVYSQVFALQTFDLKQRIMSTNTETSMLKRWKELETIHASLTTTPPHSVNPESWRRVIQETLSLVSGSSACQSMTCHMSPAMCHHCHQLTALSAVTTMMLLVKEKGEGQVEELYLQPLLQRDQLKCMVNLLQHPCQFLRYQAQKALISVMVSLREIQDTTVQFITEACVRFVLQHSTDSPVCLEPLQLLCSMLSRRSSRPLSVQTWPCLQPHLGSLFLHCSGASENSSANVHDKVSSVQKNTPGYSASKQNELALDKCAESSDSNQLKNVQYVFLCLVQKAAKLINSFESPGRTGQLERLNNSVISRLITVHVPSFSKNLRNADSTDFLLQKKILDVLDTILNYAVLRTQNIMNSVYYNMATHFVHDFQASDCSWSFPNQRTFIGDFHGGAGLRDDECHRDRSHSEMEGETVGCFGDRECSPVLVLLLSVVVKSCAIVLKAGGGQDGEMIKACTALLHSMHCHLHQLLRTHQGIAAACSTLPPHLDWLPQVCGEQDDRWIEALTCLLDIVVHVQSQCPESDDLKALATLLDPHRLFIQMLHLTHYNVSLLIDWLTSPETCFLAYLTRYLRHLVMDFETFSHAVSSWDLQASSSSSSSEDDETDESVEEVTGQGFQNETVLVELKTNKMAASSESSSTADERQLSGDCRVTYKQAGESTKQGNGKALLCCSPEIHVADTTPRTTDGGSETSDSELKVSESKLGKVTSLTRDCLNSADDGEHTDDCERVRPTPSVGLALLSSYDDEDDSLEDNEGDSMEDNEGDPATQISKASNQNTPVSQTTHPIDLVFRQSEHLKRNTEQHLLSEEGFPSTNQHTDNEIRAGEKTGADVTVDCVDRVMCLMSTLGQKLEKLDRNGLLVYNPTPLVNLIRQCELQYRSQCNV